MRYCPTAVIARNADKHDLAIPLELGDAPNSVLRLVLLRCAVVGIASSLRRLAPRNDNRGVWAHSVKCLWIDAFNTRI